MRFVLLFCGNAQDVEAWAALPEEARAQQNAKVGQWFAEYSSKFRGSIRLQPAQAAISVHFEPNGQPTITDGPFLKGTEVVGGYAEVEVADIDEALQIAKAWPARWPARNVVEIRPVAE